MASQASSIHYLCFTISCRFSGLQSSELSLPDKSEVLRKSVKCMLHAFSSLGRTKVLHATSIVLLGAKAKFLGRKPNVLVALEEISEMCQ